MGPATLAHPQDPRHASPTTAPLPALRRAATAEATATTPVRPPSRIVVPIRYSAWLNGDLGRAIERSMRMGIDTKRRVRVTRLPRALLVEADEEPGILLEAVHRSAKQLEISLEKAYPVFYGDFGPLWTGTLQAVFD